MYVKDNDMNISKSIEHLFNAIWRLGKSNRKTGLWDNRRNQLCQKHYNWFNEEQKAYLYKTEKKSRHYVEDRAKCRNQINKYMEHIILEIFVDV